MVALYPVPGYTHICNEQNVGVAKGNNQGIEASIALACTHTLLLNNDIEFEQDFLVKEMYHYSRDNNEAIIVPKIYFLTIPAKYGLPAASSKKYRNSISHRHR